jgi:hypothetical protein
MQQSNGETGGTAPVVNQYKDPYGAKKNIERIQVNQDDINDRLTLRNQYQ